MVRFHSSNRTSSTKLQQREDGNRNEQEEAQVILPRRHSNCDNVDEWRVASTHTVAEVRGLEYFFFKIFLERVIPTLRNSETMKQ